MRLEIRGAFCYYIMTTFLICNWVPMNILPKISSSGDITALSEAEINQLCAELREEILQTVSKNGGHLASNLGAVELTVAIHRVFDTATDRLVMDVGHQCYAHKLLTGRYAGFSTLRVEGGLSGFPKPEESIHDAAVAGHASVSVSVALGMARARTALGADYHVLALIGDGSISGGAAMEALSDAGHSGEPLVLILNDNGMSINRTESGMGDMLSRMRVQPNYLAFKKAYRKLFRKTPGIYNTAHRVKNRVKSRLLPENMFDDFGFEYIGPFDGHNVAELEKALRWAREQNNPCLVHVITQKGHGYPPAERHPERFHGVGGFDVSSGEIPPAAPDFSAVFGEELTTLAREDARVTAITAAMKEGTGLGAFAAEFPQRFFDVGIAEEHAVAMAAGMAARGLVPVFAVYSTFLQRAYDMLLHDVSLENLHVVLGVDRAGIVGRDGQTHQGSFDAAYLSTVPGLKLYAPASFAELRSMLRRAVMGDKGPVALRYPRGGENGFAGDTSGADTVCLREGKDVTLAVYGLQTGEALAAAEMLMARGIEAEIIKFNVLTNPDLAPLLASLKKTGRLVIAEESCAVGSPGERLLAGVTAAGVSLTAFRHLHMRDGILHHGAPGALRRELCLDAEGIAAAAAEVVHG